MFFVGNDAGEREWVVEQPAAPRLAGSAADEHGVDDGRSGAVDMDGPAHLRRARQGGGAHEAGVEDRDAYRVVGLDAVVVIGEGQGAPGLKARAMRV
jgi:hypothetical protein